MNYDNNIQPHQKTNDFKIIPGGKGINASIILNNLGIKNKAIFLAGGIMGQKFEELVKQENIDYIKINSKVETRINVKANFKDTIEMNSSGQTINYKEIEKDINSTIDKMSNEDTLMIMGSLPPGVNFNNLEQIVKRAFNKKVKLVFDLSKDFLYKLVKYNPEIIKPNKKELEELFDCKIKSKDEAFKLANKLVELGSKRVIVSFDKSGSIYTDNKSNKFDIEGVTIDEVNGSGAGDSMIAAFAAGLIENTDIKETIKLASGAGTGTASVIGIATKDIILKYKKLITIKERK